jgi:hypothetical protein
MTPTDELNAAQDEIEKQLRDLERYRDAVQRVVALIEGQPHEICDDGWYSCSQAVDPYDGELCCIDDSRRGKPCDCGVDSLTKRVKAAISEALGGER